MILQKKSSIGKMKMRIKKMTVMRKKRKKNPLTLFQDLMRRSSWN